MPAMPKRSPIAMAGLALAVVLALLAAAAAVSWHHGRDTLWRIVDDRCVPAAMKGSPSPCVEVSLARGRDAGDLVLKDRNGVLQFLLMPTARVTGIEDPRLLRPDAPPYFADAWRARRWMEARHGGPIPADDVAIALNSAWSRSQDQLHLHVSCVRAGLKARLAPMEGVVGDRWTTLPGGWNGHPYVVRRVVADSLDGVDPIRDVATNVPHAGEHMGRESVAVVGARFAGDRAGFWLLASPVAPLSGWLGGIEGDVQDHGCAVLR